LAALAYNLVAIRTQLESRADFNARDKDGDSALYLAARLGYASVIEALIDAGASPNRPNEDGRIPIKLIHTNSPLIETPAYRCL